MAGDLPPRRLRPSRGLGLVEADREQAVEVVLGVDLEGDEGFGPNDPRDLADALWDHVGQVIVVHHAHHGNEVELPGHGIDLAHTVECSDGLGGFLDLVDLALDEDDRVDHLSSRPVRRAPRPSLVRLPPARRSAPHSRSRITARPWPPEMHSVARPKAWPISRISYVRVRRRRAPLIPMGCPSEMPPPRGFSLSRSNLRSRSHAMTCAANASLISITSMSASDRPVFSSTFLVAGTGPMPMTAGSTPAHDIPASRASGRRPSAAARDSDISTRAAAPSVIPEELPAVALPFSRKTGGNAASRSSVVSGRGCSSSLTVMVPERLGSGAWTGNVSAARRSFAAWAFCCDSRANSSCSPREMSYRSTRFSAVSPMMSSHRGSRRPSRYIASKAVASPAR